VIYFFRLRDQWSDIRKTTMQLSTWSPNDGERQRRTNRRYGAQEMAGPKVQTQICIHDI
jgi:hypothetical protein